MTPEKVKQLLFEFMADIYFGPANNLKKKWDGILNELGGKLSKVLSKESEVEEYLNNVLVYIDDLNQYFVKQGRGKISYSKLFAFANKDERISDFLVDKGLEKKLSKSMGVDVAGFNYEDDEDGVLDVIYENEIYGLIYSTEYYKFFFSSAINRMLVQNIRGKNISYSEYRRKANKRKLKYIKAGRIYSLLLEKERGKSFCKNDSIEAFQDRMGYILSQKKAKKNEFRKTKKKSL